MQDNLNKYLTEIEFLHQQQLYRKPITYIPISATKVLKDNEEFFQDLRTKVIKKIEDENK